MEYRETLLRFITDGQQAEMTSWIKAHSHLDRLQIMNEFKKLMEELAEEKGMDMDDDMDAFEDAITNYQEKILDEQLASLKQEMAERNLEKKREEVDDAMVGIRKNLIKSILAHPPEEATLRELAANIIQLEKDNELFDPENWKGLL